MENMATKNGNMICKTCGGPCIYPGQHAETAGEDYGDGVSFMACWTPKAADDEGEAVPCGS